MWLRLFLASTLCPYLKRAERLSAQVNFIFIFQSRATCLLWKNFQKYFHRDFIRLKIFLKSLTVLFWYLFGFFESNYFPKNFPKKKNWKKVCLFMFINFPQVFFAKSFERSWRVPLVLVSFVLREFMANILRDGLAQRTSLKGTPAPASVYLFPVGASGRNGHGTTAARSQYLHITQKVSLFVQVLFV